LEASGPAEVLDLSVDGPHCFFAAGVLVHNKSVAYSPFRHDAWYRVWPCLTLARVLWPRRSPERLVAGFLSMLPNRSFEVLGCLAPAWRKTVSGDKTKYVDQWKALAAQREAWRLPAFSAADLLAGRTNHPKILRVESLKEEGYSVRVLMHPDLPPTDFKVKAGRSGRLLIERW
jgi:hypothetical protein